jgi:hypothetical protein
MTDRDLIELYEERAAILEHDGGLPRHLAEQKAYWQWRQIVGKCKAPQHVIDTVERAKRQQSGKAG